MKKAFRGIKRGVNKNVLKVPSIEQKVLDATSNESSGPHGTHLSDIAQASRNYHEYQIIMSVVWKRISDTGKNWRHVYKALTVLEYLVANGSERVIEDIRDHAYQISNLASFQYIDSSGRDQGINVRKKSQSLVALVNDKEQIQEAREKAAASRDKFRNTSGGPGDDRYDGQYGSRDEDRNGYGRERDWNYRNSYEHDGGDRYGRDGYGDNEYRGKSQSIDGDYGAKSQSSDRDDGHQSSRGSNARVEDGSPDESRLEQKLSAQNAGAPPRYEDAVSEAEKPPLPANHQESVIPNNSAPPPPAATSVPSNETDEFDFFDPRGAPPAAPAAPSSAEVDLFGSLSDSFSSNALDLVPSEPLAITSSNASQTFVASSSASQQYENPFGDDTFKAVPSSDAFSVQQSTSPFGEPPQTAGQTTVNDMGFGDGFDPSVDILAGILPPTGPPALPSQPVTQAQPDQQSTQTSFHPQTSQPNHTSFSSSYPDQFGQSNHIGQPNQASLPLTSSGQFGQAVPPPDLSAQNGHQSISPLDFSTQGSQSELLSGFPAQNGQSVLPLAFPAQSSQSMFEPSLPAAQGGQSELLSSFLSQGSQSVLPPAFPSQSSQSTLPLGAPAAQNGQSELLSSFPSQSSQAMFPPSFPAPHGGQSGVPSGFPAQSGQSMLPPGFPGAQSGQLELPSTQGGQSVLPPSFPAGQGGQSEFLSAPVSQSMFLSGFPAGQGGQSVSSVGFTGSQNASLGGISSQSATVSQAGFSNFNGQTSQPLNNLNGGFQPHGQPTSVPNFYQQPQPQPQPQLQSNTSIATKPPSVTASTGALALAPQQPAKEKFETKSTVWSDTLNRGLVNLNISGPKTNPLSDIGIDFDAINRKEKRMEKPSKTPVTSNVTMGKAMGSGSGIGRAGASALRPAPNPMAGSGMGMGMGMGGPGFGGGYGGVMQPMGMNNMPQNMSMGMNNGQGFQMQPRPATGFMPPAGSYNPMMGGYGQQQPYGGYR